MKEEMRKILIVSFFLFFGIGVHAQISRMFFFSGGMSLLTDVIITPSEIEDYGTYSICYQHLQWNYGTFSFAGRMNIANLGQNATLSLSTSPTLGLGMAYALFKESGTWYSAGASIPAFIELNLGAASRFIAKSNYGIVIGGGYEYNMYPIIAYPISNTQLTYKDLQKKWNQLVFELGIRYWSQKNRVNEINFKVGYGEKGKEFTNFDGNTEKSKQLMSFRLSFIKILNY